jgi:mRNA interferase MazF
MNADIYPRGTVLFTEVQFSGSIGSKRRPVVVLSTESFHQAGTKLIVVSITSTVTPPFRPGDVLLSDWLQAGLMKPSAARGGLALIDRNEIVRKLGQLSERDFAGIEQGVASIMGFAVLTDKLSGT